MTFFDEIIKKSQEAYTAFCKLSQEENGNKIKIKIKVFEDDTITYKTFWISRKKFETIKEAIKKLYLFDKIPIELMENTDKNSIFWGVIYYNPPLKEWILKKE